MESKLTFIHALSPLHAGTGQGVGVIDLPIAREKATNIPYLPGSSVKGSLRDEFNDDANLRDKIFGPEKVDGNNGYAGAIQFTDQTLLCLPVRSLAGTFAYVTSPYILRRLKRDAESAKIDVADFKISTINQKFQCHISSDKLKLSSENMVVLEDLDLTPTIDADLAKWFQDKLFIGSDWQAIFAARICVVHDDIFSFLLQTSTQIMARIKLDDNTKTTSDGALWYEEALPTESILFGLALAFPNDKTRKSDETKFTPKDIFDEVEKKLKKNDLPKSLQFGGNATVGRGLCQMNLI